MPQRLTIARDARDDSEVDGSDLDNLDTFHGWDSDTDELGDCRDHHGPGMTETSLFDAIPELEKYMQKHQKEGFQFLWRNLAGLGPGGLMTEIGGCVLSHAPGTGKTFLIISFLQSYMSANPNCRPLIIAPKIMLQPWEQEFRKWNVDIPVYILNRASEYGRQLVKEHEKDGQLHLVGGTTRRKTDNSRLVSKQPLHKFGLTSYCKKMNGWSFLRVILENSRDHLSLLPHVFFVFFVFFKLMCSLANEQATLWEWRQNPSVLVVSYAMFTSLTDDANHSLERATIRQNLLEASNMLILDEGHFARNRKAKVRKALMLVKTKKRVLLSGTLFQNNFEELFTTLYLVRPRFVETFSELSGNDSIVQVVSAPLFSWSGCT
jgi:DNA repair and recombination RAD54-like protein